MVRLSLVLLATASSAFAVPAPATNAATTVFDAFRALRSHEWTPDAGLAKRQSTSDVINGLQDLLEKAVASQESSSSRCHDECSGWFGLIEKCADNDSYYQVGLCACGSRPVNEMKTCGKCFGGSSSTDASNFGDYCQKAGVASAASSSSSSNTRGSFGGLSDAASRTATFASASAAGAAGSATQQASVSSVSSPANTAGVTGGAATIKYGSGAVIGAAAAGVAALLAL